MFAYCLNNPVNMADTTGNFPWLVVGILAALTALGGVLGANADQKLWKEVEKPDISTKVEAPPAPPNINMRKVLSQNITDVLSTTTSQYNIEYENTTLTTGDRVINTLIGGSLGLASGGIIIAGVGAGMVVLGMEAGLQIWAIGALAFDLVAMLVAPVIGIEMEPIEVKP